MQTCPPPPTLPNANCRRQNKVVADQLQLHLALDPDLVDWTLDNYQGAICPDDLDQWLRSASAATQLKLSHPDWVLPPMPEREPNGTYRHYIPSDQSAPCGSFEAFVRHWAARFRGEGLCWQDTEDRRNDVRLTLHERWGIYDAGANVRWAAVARNHPDSLTSKLAGRERAVRKQVDSLDASDDPDSHAPKEWADCAAAESWQLISHNEGVQAFTRSLENSSLVSVLQNPRRRALLDYFLTTPGASVGAFSAQTGRDKTQVSAELRQVLRALVGRKYADLLRHMRADRFLAALPPLAHDALAQLVHSGPSVPTLASMAPGASTALFGMKFPPKSTGH
jgi:hypothetical protein